MKKKILLILLLSFILICFFIIYNKLNTSYEKYTLVLLLIYASLLQKKINLKYSLTLVILSSIISIFAFGFTYQTLAIFSVTLSIIPILLIFSVTKDDAQYPKLKRRNDELIFYKEELLNEENYLIEEKESLERKLERITNFFIISKDLTKNIDIPEESANALLNILSTRVGINYVVISTKNHDDQNNKNKLKILSRLDEHKKEIWDKLINNNKEIENIKSSTIIKSLFDIELKPVIAWPMIIDNDLNSCIFLVVDDNYSQKYIEEGELFIPHLKLGTKRLMLFTELKEKSRVDGLTGLYLKRYFLEKFYSEIEKAKRYKTNFYIMMLDIDFFKKVNDTYGHLIGDRVLKETANIISNSVRPGDIVGRYGGEEFIILFPIIEENDVIEIAQKIRNSIKEVKFKDGKKSFSVTISIGISKYIEDLSPENLIDNTDKALYEAKHSGRDRVNLFSKDK